jgi:UDP-2,4-diacetamido-2,4,6-trideoxy-beta-L-altropyranose hydrolase
LPWRFQEIKLINVHIAFRVDASYQIGTGHLMRCLALADAIHKQGANICFVSRHMPDYLQSMIEERGYIFKRLTSSSTKSDEQLLDHSHWLGTSQCADAVETLNVLSSRLWDWLIVDHYALDNQWESLLRSSAKKIMVIDDLGDRVHDCDMLLDQNFYLDMHGRYNDKVPPGCKLLLGPTFALLRPDFKILRDRSKVCKDKVKRVLIFFGGVDPLNYTSHAIKVLASLRYLGLHVDVVIGMQHPKRDEIESQCATLGFSCHIQTNKIAELMSSADIAIGAGGISTWERCCLGLPSLVFSTAINQQQQLSDAACEGLLYAPDMVELDEISLATHIQALIENTPLRTMISANGMRFVDGFGVMRVVGNLEMCRIEMRLATKEDACTVFNWRNHESIRNVSRSNQLIEWTEHQVWFNEILTCSESNLLIGMVKGSKIGVVRYDYVGNEAEISIYLAPEKVVSGYGAGLLKSAEQWLRLNKQDIQSISAYVLGHNTRSAKFFTSAGYSVKSTNFIKRLDK